MKLTLYPSQHYWLIPHPESNDIKFGFDLRTVLLIAWVSKKLYLADRCPKEISSVTVVLQLLLDVEKLFIRFSIVRYTILEAIQLGSIIWRWERVQKWSKKVPESHDMALFGNDEL